MVDINFGNVHFKEVGLQFDCSPRRAEIWARRRFEGISLDWWWHWWRRCEHWEKKRKKKLEKISHVSYIQLAFEQICSLVDQ